MQRIRARRPPEREDSETSDRFGRPSRFQITDPEQPTNPSYVVQPRNPDDPEEPEEPPQLLVYREVQKELEEVRVENPDDPEQYIITKRRLWSLFLGPDGLYRQFVWDNSDIDG